MVDRIHPNRVDEIIQSADSTIRWDDVYGVIDSFTRALPEDRVAQYAIAVADLKLHMDWIAECVVADSALGGTDSDVAQKVKRGDAMTPSAYVGLVMGRRRGAQWQHKRILLREWLKVRERHFGDDNG